jgi:uncharacterized Zn ribbon protein
MLPVEMATIGQMHPSSDNVHYGATEYVFVPSTQNFVPSTHNLAAQNSQRMRPVQNRPYGMSVHGGSHPPPASAVNPVGASGAAAAAAPVDGISLWRRHMFAEAVRVSKAFKKKVAEEHQRVKANFAKQIMQCQRCQKDYFPPDMVAFQCVQRTRESAKSAVTETHEQHRFCTDCVTLMLTDLARGVRHINCKESSALLAEMNRLCNGRLQIAVCPQCNCPNVVISAVQFRETFARDRIDARLQYTVHLGATQVLASNFVVDTVCENQRRPFFGAFSRDNLLVVDFCGPLSTDRETNASEIEDLEQTLQRPNNSWAWLADWSPDTTLTGDGAWRYAQNFKAMWPREWSSTPAMLMFVRRRRLRRVRVRFSAEVQLALQGYFRESQDE